jgi:DNA ligase 1
MEKQSERVFPPNAKVSSDSNKDYIVFNNSSTGIMLAKPYADNIKYTSKETNPPIGWYAYEKYDGVRAIWTGKELIARPTKKKGDSLKGKVFGYVPDWFTERLPQGIALDGELWAGRGLFDTVAGLSNMKLGGKHRTQELIDDIWRKMKYVVFDIPSNTIDPLSKRVELLKELVTKIKSKYIVYSSYDVITSDEQMKALYASYTENGAEGIIIRSPDSFYEHKRSKYLLKMKLHDDAEATVVGYDDGSGKYKGMLGSLICVTNSDDSEKNKIKFKIGTGLNDAIRSKYNDPDSIHYIPIGSTVSYAYMELTKNNIPRHPVYRGVRHDV